MRDQHQIPRDLAGAAMLSNHYIVKKMNRIIERIKRELNKVNKQKA